ncbi:proto-oncogene Mas-like [Thamnophis elegans]|uniref:proto-oncogene Mas-like n=1 Tax=Thamnophis elegans TaxID=35005 RepID=UPI001378BE24|nr:proto-oncogene Mas-like [Thamnophis elegans]
MDMASPSPFTVLSQINATSNGKNRACNDSGKEEEVLIFAIFTILFCVLGMLANGLVIWLLGSSVKRNTFAIYIINLSVADFGFLTFELIIEIHWLFTRLYCNFPYELFQMILRLMYSAGQFLLTVISIDRCLSVLFPIWYRCHRPVHMFTTVCAVICAVSFILSSILFTIITVLRFGNSWVIYQFIVNIVLCLPLMTISSVTLFIKICFVSKSQRRRKLLTAILLTLFFFLVLAFPLNAFYFIRYVFEHVHPNLVHYGYLCACINSSINPMIYYLVGRQKDKTQRSMKEVLQRVFKEEENCTDQM